MQIIKLTESEKCLDLSDLKFILLSYSIKYDNLDTQLSQFNVITNNNLTNR